MTRFQKTGVACAMLIVGSAVVWAQTKTEDTAGSLAALTAEVRLLRVAVEDASRAQTQTQALSVALAAQQSRMQQLSARIDAVKRDVATAEQSAKQTAFMLKSAQDGMAGSDPAERKQSAEILPMFKQQADATAATLNDLRRRELDLQQAMQMEEQRWQDLINRLEAAIRK